MKRRFRVVVAAWALSLLVVAAAQGAEVTLPSTVTAGAAFSIATSGSGNADLYIVGPGQVLHRKVQLGNQVHLAAGVLYNAGRYLVLLAGGSATDTKTLDVVPEDQAKQLAFLAEPSRLPVDQKEGISGTAYIFDSYRNLITEPKSVSFDLSDVSGKGESHVAVTSRNGVAWTRMNSASKEGRASFVASVEGASSKRVIDQVPGEPCSLRMTAQPKNGKVLLQTAPVLDCSGNLVPDGTIVTFTERLNNKKSTVDVPLKKGIARVEMPAWDGATISVASGVVAGNEIRLRGGE